MKNLKYPLITAFLFSAICVPTSFAQQPRAGHDELKTFLDCEVKSQGQKSQADCVAPARPERRPTQEKAASKNDIKMKELKADKAPVEEFGHPHFFHAQPRGGASPR
jgi:hypothetical protein